MSNQTMDSLAYKISSKAGKSVIRVLEHFITKTTGNQYLFDHHDFPWTLEIEKLYPQIAEEFKTFYEKHREAIPDICEISQEQYKVIEKTRWDFIPLYGYGRKLDIFCRQFPVTLQAISNIPRFTTVFFSILNPNATIAPHRGAYKGYLRYHLGVKIPKPESSCGLKIDNNIFHWHNGKSIIFDDTHIHSAWNNSDQIRVVLYADFIRPLSFPLTMVSSALTKLIGISPFIGNAITRLSRFENDHQLQKVLR